MWLVDYYSFDSVVVNDVARMMAMMQGFWFNPRYGLSFISFAIPFWRYLAN
jgi:hypothetical protein